MRFATPVPVTSVLLLILALTLAADLGRAQDDDIPEVVKTLLAEGDRHRQAGRLDQAIASYEEAQKLAPTVVEAYVALGALYSGQGDLERALATFVGGLEHEAEQPNLLFNAAVLALRLERFDDALGYADRALTKNKKDANLQSVQAAILRGLGRLDEALASQEQAAKLDANNPQILYRLGNLYYDLEKKNEAIDAFRKAIKKDKNYLRAYYNLGAVLFDVGRFDEALDAYEVALEPIQKSFASGEVVDGAHARAFLNLGAIHYQKEEWDAALDAYGKALRLDPRQPGALYNQGFIHFQRGDLDAAYAAYKNALEIDPSLPLACLHLGEIHHRRGEYAAAVPLLKRALGKLEGDDLRQANLVIAQSHKALGQSNEAIAAYRAVLAVEADNVTALSDLGRLLRDSGDAAGARGLLEQARGLAPESAGVALELAGLARDDGDLGREKALYQEILERSGSDPGIWPLRVNLARVLVEEGDRAGARKTFEPVIAKVAELRQNGLGERDSHLLVTAYGLLLASEGQLDEAGRRFSTVVGEDASFTPARDAVAVLAALGGDPSAAAQALAATLPSHVGQSLEPQARANLGQALWLAGRAGEAREHLESAARALPDNVGLRAALGEIALAAGEVDRAITELEAAVARCGAPSPSPSPGSPAAAGRRLQVMLGEPASAALCERTQGVYGKALVAAALNDLANARSGSAASRGARQRAERALDLPLGDVDRSIALFVRGTVQLLTGADQGARTDLTAALDNLPATLQAVARTNLGVARYRLGEVQAARQQFEAAGTSEATLNLGILFDDQTGDAERALQLYEEYLARGGRRRADAQAWAERLRKVYR